MNLPAVGAVEVVCMERLLVVRYQTVLNRLGNVNILAAGAFEVVGVVRLLLVYYQTVFDRLM